MKVEDFLFLCKCFVFSIFSILLIGICTISLNAEEVATDSDVTEEEVVEEIEKEIDSYALADVYEFPKGSCYVDGDDSRLGSVRVYLPCDVTSSLHYDDSDNVINTSSQTIQGYFENRGDLYSVSFQPYQYGRYRLDSDREYNYLSDFVVDSVNAIIGDESSIWWTNGDLVRFIGIFIFGGFACLMLLKH